MGLDTSMRKPDVSQFYVVLSKKRKTTKGAESHKHMVYYKYQKIDQSKHIGLFEQCLFAIITDVEPSVGRFLDQVTSLSTIIGRQTLSSHRMFFHSRTNP